MFNYIMLIQWWYHCLLMKINRSYRNNYNERVKVADHLWESYLKTKNQYILNAYTRILPAWTWVKTKEDILKL